MENVLEVAGELRDFFAKLKSQIDSTLWMKKQFLVWRKSAPAGVTAILAILAQIKFGSAASIVDAAIELQVLLERRVSEQQRRYFFNEAHENTKRLYGETLRALKEKLQPLVAPELATLASAPALKI
jgi:hypothetical protein